MTPKWTRAQIEAMIELGGGTERLVDEPEAQRYQGCICTNGHQPDENGNIYTAPSCELHGLRNHWIPQPALRRQDRRTEGVIHTGRERRQ